MKDIEKAKVKAKEIADRFDYPSIKTGLMSSEVKLCAIICIEEILHNADNFRINGEPNHDEHEFWELVKSEVDNL